MKPRLAALAVLLLSVVTRTYAHQLDEYLQATILAVEKDRLKADLFLTPGAAVLPIVLKEIDADGDGVISPAEQIAYAKRVLYDLSLTLNGERLTPRFVTVEFPPLDEMKEGRGDIHLEFSATLPPAGPDRRLHFENHHQSSIAAYQVNCLVPTTPAIRLGLEHRNYSQSVYELDFIQAGARSASPSGRSAFVWGGRYLGAGALVLLACATVRRRRRSRARETSADRNAVSFSCEIRPSGK